MQKRAMNKNAKTFFTSVLMGGGKNHVS